MSLLKKKFVGTVVLVGTLIVGGFSSVARAAPMPSRWATLEAIHQLENPRNVSTPGRHGELGPYQFRAQTWRMHTTLPFTQALDRRTADEVAVKHYEWIKSGLERAGLSATSYNIAMAWNGGLDGVVRDRAPVAAHDYAERAANLAAVLSARIVVANLP